MAEIMSPVYRGSAPKCRLTFAYYLYGNGVGSLEVKVMSGGDSTTYWKHSGNSGDAWFDTAIQIGRCLGRVRINVPTCY